MNTSTHAQESATGINKKDTANGKVVWLNEFRGAMEPFSFLYPELRDDPNARFAEKAQNICQGAALCLRLTQSSELTRAHNRDADRPEDQELPLLSLSDTDVAMRFALLAVDMLGDMASEQIDRLNELVARRGGK